MGGFRRRRRRGETIFDDNPGARRRRAHYNVGIAAGTRDPRTGRVLPGMEDADRAAFEEWRATGESRRDLDERVDRRDYISADGGRDRGPGIDDPVPSGMYGDPSFVDYQPQYEDSLNPRFQLGESQEAQAAADPRDIQAQRRALEYFQGVNRAGGWTPAEAMQLQTAGLEAAQLERGQREALMQNAAARGMAGAGTELAGSLAAQQGGANRAHQWATDIATEGQRRAFEAAQQAGALSSGMRGQGFDESRARGRAADDFTRSNVDYARGAENRNVDRTNRSRERRADLPLEVWGLQHGAAMDAEEVRARRKQREDEERARRASGAMQLIEGAAGMFGGMYGGGSYGGGGGG